MHYVCDEYEANEGFVNSSCFTIILHMNPIVCERAIGNISANTGELGDIGDSIESNGIVIAGILLLLLGLIKGSQ